MQKRHPKLRKRNQRPLRNLRRLDQPSRKQIILPPTNPQHRQHFRSAIPSSANLSEKSGRRLLRKRKHRTPFRTETKNLHSPKRVRPLHSNASRGLLNASNSPFRSR